MLKVKDWLYTWQLPIAFALSAAVYGVDHWFYGNHLLTDVLCPVRKEVYSTLATIFGALLGFVLTAFSIVASFGENEAIKRLRSSGDYGRITTAFIRTTYTIGFAALVALVAIFVDGRPDTTNRFWEYAVLFTSVWATLSLLGTIYVLETLVDAANKSNASSPGR